MKLIKIYLPNNKEIEFKLDEDITEIVKMIEEKYPNYVGLEIKDVLVRKLKR